MDLSFNRLLEVLVSLIGKKVTVTFTNGDDISCVLREILPDALVVENGKGKIGVPSSSCICYVLEEDE